MSSSNVIELRNVLSLIVLEMTCLLVWRQSEKRKSNGRS